MFKQTYFPFDAPLASQIFPQSTASLSGGSTTKNTVFWLSMGLALVAILVFLYVERENLIYPLFSKQVKEELDSPHKVVPGRNL